LQWTVLQQQNSNYTASFTCDLTNRGLDATLAGDYTVAEKLFRRSLSLETKNGSLLDQAADWRNLGVLYNLKGAPDKGIYSLCQALRLHRNLNDYQEIGSDLMNLAELFRMLSQCRTTINCLRNAVRSFKQAHAMISAE